jgi:hypothetical protein
MLSLLLLISFFFLRLINAAFRNRQKRIENLTRMGKIHELMLGLTALKYDSKTI